jgi:DNA-binding transcriptional LysR family regulator
MSFLYDMDLLAHVEAFVAVAERRGFTRAAEALHLPQPALSRRVGNLERVWGGVLLQRGPREATLTPFGELVLPHAQELLERARHLTELVACAGESEVSRIGVPAGCRPAALARILRAGEVHAVALAVREAGPRERADGVDSGELAAAAVRGGADTGPLTVRLGLATAEPWPAAAVHLDALRPRRGVDARPPSLLVTAEDEVEPFGSELARALARAGVPAERLSSSPSPAAAAAEVLAGEAWLLCDAPFARQYELCWAPLADPSLHRGYELVAGSASARSLLEWLAPLLARAIGADPVARDGRRDDDRERAVERLAVRG